VGCTAPQADQQEGKDTFLCPALSVPYDFSK